MLDVTLQQEGFKFLNDEAWGIVSDYYFWHSKLSKQSVWQFNHPQKQQQRVYSSWNLCWGCLMLMQESQKSLLTGHQLEKVSKQIQMESLYVKHQG